MFVFIMIRNSTVPRKTDKNTINTNITYLEITDLTCNITLWDPPICHTHQRYIVHVKSFMLMCASENVPYTQTQCYTFGCCDSPMPCHSNQRPEVFPFTSIFITIPITH